MRQTPSYEKDEALKLRFARDSLRAGDPFAVQTSVHDDVADALRWHAERSPLQVLREREKVMRQLERDASKLWCASSWHVLLHCVSPHLAHVRRDGSCTRWLDGTSQETRKLAKTVNGPMLQIWAQRVGHEDADCVELFRSGPTHMFGW